VDDLHRGEAIVRSLILLGFLAAGTAQAQEAFQGIQWGATEQQIRAKFGDRVSERECNDTWRGLDKTSAVKLCGAPIIKDYVVAGYPFEVGFSFGKQTGRLESVSLVLKDEVSQSEVRAVSTMRYEEIKSLLSQKYGQPAWDKAKSLQITDIADALWQTGSNSIKLSKLTFHSGSYLIEIHYNPLKSPEADKL
jgi:hypothetical protein